VVPTGKRRACLEGLRRGRGGGSQPTDDTGWESPGGGPDRDTTMSTLSTVVEAVIYGVSLGMIYLLVALGLALIFGLMDVINFAHGALVTLGAYVGLTAWNASGSYWLSLVAVAVLVGLLGAGIERGLVSRLYDADHIFQLLLTFGVALIIEGLLIVQYGEGNQRLTAPAFTQGSPVPLGPALIPRYRLFIIFFTALVVAAVWLTIQRSRLGLIIKAGIQDRERTLLLGIRLGRVNMLVFAVGAGLAAIGGFLAGPLLGVSPTLGTDLLITSFAIVIIGGLGDIRGTIVAALLLGIVYNLSLFFYPPIASAMIFIVMATVLVLKPEGLFGEATA
jgi:branched-subunit amino acid ABC-type transport system permease component